MILLPIDPLLPEIRLALEQQTNAVVTAEPGAGKTTRVPPALLPSSFAKDKEIWVLQPRRLAAKLAALRVSEELGTEPGKLVGYQFRFEKKVGPETRLRFMTDGMLLPLSQGDPLLSKVAAVILDEFHERSLALELGLAWLRRLQQKSRPDLRLVVMSATLNSEALSGYLGNCPVFNSKGRVFPVTVEYLPQPEQPDLALKVKSAVKQLAAKGPGTTLVFLPGLYEINKCREALKSEPLEVHSLYGDLSVEEQQRVLTPSEGRKVILSTNVAETSLTVPGVTAVVDSGLTRQARVSAWSGLSSLVTIPASQASSTQRTGRAGRLQAGHCLRLFSKFDFDHRAAFDLPELLRSDLSKCLLDLKCLLSFDKNQKSEQSPSYSHSNVNNEIGSGVEDLDSFPWFLKPPAAMTETALSLLRRLGALDVKNGLTEVGRRMSRFPLAPRLARFLIKVEELTQPIPSRERGKDKNTESLLSEACRLAALISEERAASEDLLEELKRFKPGFESKRLEEQLTGLMKTPETTGVDKSRPAVSDKQTLLAKALLCAFPDRVAMVRPDSSSTRNRSGKVRELLLSSGGMLLAQDNALTRSHEMFVVVEAQEGTGAQSQTKARSLCPIEMDWLLDLFPEYLSEERSLEWNAKAGRVEGFKRLKYGQLVLDEKPLAAGEFGPEGAAILLKEALSTGVQSYCDPDELAAFLNRVKFAAGRTKALQEITSAGVEETLKELCSGIRSLNDLKEAGLVRALKAKLSPQDQALLEKLTPGSLLLPSGRRLEIHYEADKSPWAQSRLQDFLGMVKGPSVAGGEMPVVLHLLSPGKKPVQITSDLAGFWKNHYPQVRKELMRRYPRHQWPENPLQK